ncbi:MAG: RecQ family ATP-dependent DNA helicase [Tannerellaceae bacterium]|jgi:ATP-dependent DNA helicase RecQ|nr:RecQ family ATP-dependent DNA helicase [Tannerellaceae bacterium]
MDIYHSILKQYWGYEAFRPLQEEIIHSLAAGKDTLGLMPTGGGKSITFQVPALAVDGICIVVTPLIALMKDQVDSLRKLGIKATTVFSGMDRQMMIVQLENCIYGDYKFLYVSPERLATDLFLAKLKAMNVSYLVVDESHCISQWGYDFRPAYLSIADIRRLIPDVPVLALTATATTEVIRDIQEKLRFKTHNVFVKSFMRKNIAYVVRRTDNAIAVISSILKAVPGTSIVYVRNRRRTKEIADELKQAGFQAEHFHAGLDPAEKNTRQNRWKSGECRVIVSTNAFGMGIDKPDVRTVIHVDMPSTLEEYFQEAGRAGRDGKKAYAVAICNTLDVKSLKLRFANEYPDRELIARVYEALGNFYQIGVGFGFGTAHELPMDRFCTAFGFFPVKVHNALKILELAGYLEYQEEAENPSRLLFNVGRDELYKIRFEERRFDDVINSVLRLYTGLFSEYAFVEEYRIAQHAGCTTAQVVEVLIALSKRHIISYIPKKRIPMVIYVQRREEQRYLDIPRTAYEDRKERMEKRISKVIEYIENDSKCRSRILLEYFGENDAPDCGVCDICLSRRRPELSDDECAAIRAALIAAYAGVGAVHIPDIVEQLPYPPGKTLKTIIKLTRHDPKFILEEGYCLKILGDAPSSNS